MESESNTQGKKCDFCCNFGARRCYWCSKSMCYQCTTYFKIQSTDSEICPVCNKFCDQHDDYRRSLD